MSNTDPKAVAVRAAGPPGASLRLRGSALFVLLVVEVLLGSELANLGSPYPISLLAAHILIGLALIGFSGYTLLVATRGFRAAARGSAVLTCLATVAAVVAGFVFLFGGQTAGAELSMEGFGVLALLGALLLIVFGGARTLAAAAPSTNPS